MLWSWSMYINIYQKYLWPSRLEEKPIQDTQSCEKTPDMCADKPEIISELLRLGLFPAKPEVETDLRSQEETHHGSVGFGGIGIKSIHIALFSIYSSASFQVKYARMNKRQIPLGIWALLTKPSTTFALHFSAAVLEEYTKEEIVYQEQSTRLHMSVQGW